MRKKVIGLVSLAAPALIGALAASCDKAGNNPLTEASEGLCGPCGVVARGDVGISGSAKLDGIFSAVATLNGAVGTINADFEANLDSLMATFGAEAAANASIDAKVTSLLAKVKADVNANLEGDVKVVYQPAECKADVSLSVQAEANCEVKAGCEVSAECEAMVDPGSVEVKCEGKCEGSCSAGCTGGFKCDVSATGECKGTCEGSCQLEAAAKCEGTCHGDCSAGCSATGADGQCNGSCEGDCEGTCELSAGASCSGKCSGSCNVTAEADCPGGKVECSGSCTGTCKGSCTGNATPPSASASCQGMAACDASADCQASAKAQGSASLTCTPPSLKLDYGFKADVDADARASFIAHMGELRVKGAAMIQGFAKYSALFDGKIDGKVVINPSPVASIIAQVQAMANLDASASVLAEIPKGRIACVIPAFEEAAVVTGNLVSKSAANIAAQGKFAVALSTGKF
jgi:modification target Cys-rich repeat protein